MNYTKGEWKLFRLSQHHHWKIKTGEDNDFIDCGMNEANAHLIAAAPDMYEALKDLAACFRNIELVASVQNADEKAFLGIAVNAMTKALAKAEGLPEK